MSKTKIRTALAMADKFLADRKGRQDHAARKHVQAALAYMAIVTAPQSKPDAQPAVATAEKAATRKGAK